MVEDTADLPYNSSVIAHSGEWPSGKAPDSGSGDRRFESYLASQDIIFQSTPVFIEAVNQTD
jgi:hypothetical protein